MQRQGEWDLKRFKSRIGSERLILCVVGKCLPWKPENSDDVLRQIASGRLKPHWYVFSSRRQTFYVPQESRGDGNGAKAATESHPHQSPRMTPHLPRYCVINHGNGNTQHNGTL